MHYFYYIFGTLLTATSSQALLCYNCTYMEGHRGSTEDCKKSNPGHAYLIDCNTKRSGDINSTEKLQMKFGAHEKALTRATNSYASEKKDEIYCVKVDGILSGRIIIYKTCVVKNWEDDRNNQCLQSNASQEILIPGKGSVYGQLCYCTGSKCNAAPTKNKYAFFVIIFLLLLSQFK